MSCFAAAFSKPLTKQFRFSVLRGREGRERARRGERISEHNLRVGTNRRAESDSAAAEGYDRQRECEINLNGRLGRDGSRAEPASLSSKVNRISLED